MTTLKLISIILVFILVSCSDNRQQIKLKQEIPKALEDKSSWYKIVAKSSSYDDLVESLYNELVSKDVNLKELENKIEELKKLNSSATEVFGNYNVKNQSYFSSADRHVSEIKDSLLRNKIKAIVANQLTKYNLSIATHKEFLKLIEEKQLTITDLYTIVKIVKTLPLIDKYQKDNLPSTKPFEEYIKRQNGTIKLADDISDK